MKYLEEIIILQDKANTLKTEMIGVSSRIRHSELEDRYFEIRGKIKSLVKKGERK